MKEMLKLDWKTLNLPPKSFEEKKNYLILVSHIKASCSPIAWKRFKEREGTIEGTFIKDRDYLIVKKVVWKCSYPRKNSRI
jgi:hypothetical protein